MTPRFFSIAASSSSPDAVDPSRWNPPAHAVCYVDRMSTHPNVTADVVPFPLVRRRDLVCRLVRRCVELSPDAAESHLRRQIDVHAAAMARKGIAAGRVTSEGRALEAAVRAAVWREVLTLGGAA